MLVPTENINLKANTEIEINTIMFEKKLQINKLENVWRRQLV